MLSGRAHYGCARLINYFHVPRHAEPSHDPEYAFVMLL